MKDILKRIKLNEGTVSALMGIVVLVLAGWLVLRYVKSINRGDITDKSAQTAVPTLTQEQLEKRSVEEAVVSGLPTTYVIKTGDSLWSISERAYGTGYAWSQVYEVNKNVISNPSQITEGMTINLPKIEVKTTSHTVTAGENLWSISQQICGNGYVWPQVAAENNLANPGMIHPGNVLKVTCR